MKISEQIVDNVQVVEVGEVNLGEEKLILDVGNRLQKLALQNDTGQMLLDLGPVNYISSLMVGQLISLNKICGREHVDLKICKVSVVIMEVLKLVRADKLIRIYPDRESAMTAFASHDHDTRETEIGPGLFEEVRTNASQGNADFQYQLGACYEEGNGIDADPKEALKWFQLAADQGHSDAKYKVGMAYAYGIGTTQDFDEAMPWYLQAAEAGHADAQYMTGLALQHGLAGTTDVDRAAGWYDLASKQGHEKAREALAGLPEN